MTTSYGSPGPRATLPGYVLPGAPPDPLRPTRGLGIATSVMLGVTGIVALVSGLASRYRAGTINDFLAGREVGTGPINSADVLVGIVALLHSALFLGTAVVFIIWSWRMIKNSQLLDPDDASKAGWAIGGWFIPVAQFVIPAYLLAKVDGIFGRLVLLDHRSGEPELMTRRSTRPLIILWCLLFFAATAANRVIWQDVGDELAAIAAADSKDIWARLVSAAAALVAILMIHQMHRRQLGAFGARAARARADAEERLRRAAVRPSQAYSRPLERGEIAADHTSNPQRPASGPPITPL